MAGSRGTGVEIDEELLPAAYDRLVSAEKLVHGRYNPRRVRPSEELRASVTQTGLDQPLIVRPGKPQAEEQEEEEEESEVYHITDGWQRYQAATECGWEVLPVRMFESAVEALEATETRSIVREWSTYEWAKYCEAVAAELRVDSGTELIEEVADRTTRSAGTVRRYLDVLSLPEEIHPLLIDGPDGGKREWAALGNYNEEVRRYDGLSWRVAGYLARRQEGVDADRTIGIAALAVEFRESEDAMEFIDRACECAERPLESICKEVRVGQQHPQILEIPRVVVQLDRSEKEAIMEYCRENRHSLRDIVTERIESLARDLQIG